MLRYYNLISLLMTTLGSTAEINQTVIDENRTDSMMAAVSAAPVSGWTSLADGRNTASSGPFSQ